MEIDIEQYKKMQEELARTRKLVLDLLKTLSCSSDRSVVDNSKRLWEEFCESNNKRNSIHFP